MTGISATSSVAIPHEPGDEAARRASFDRARAKLQRHGDIWETRRLTQEIYRGYHKAIVEARSPVVGTDLEVGSGHGSFAEFHSGVVSCDIVPCSWLDCAADAARLPFRSASLSNIIMIDVLHHVADPVGFFSEAARTLAPSGRILLIEPYVSPISRFAWRFLGEEPIDTAACPLADAALKPPVSADNPWDANVAVPTLLFWRDSDAFRIRFPNLSIIHRRRFDLLLYPLSGGFERRRFVPMPLVPLVRACERLLMPLAPLLAFRCFVVIEKMSGDSGA
jgi:SAM-dependent methyltransferase